MAISFFMTADSTSGNSDGGTDSKSLALLFLVHESNFYVNTKQLLSGLKSNPVSSPSPFPKQ